MAERTKIPFVTLDEASTAEMVEFLIGTSGEPLVVIKQKDFEHLLKLGFREMGVVTCL